MMSINDEHVTHVIQIHLNEWREVQNMLSCVWREETKALGFVRLMGDGSRRWWYVSDSYRMVRLAGEPDSQAFDVLIAPRLILMADTVADIDGSTELLLRDDPDRGGPTIAIRGGHGEAESWAPKMQYPIVDSIFDELDGIDSLIRIDNERLRSALSTVSFPPVDPDEGAPPASALVGSGPGHLWLRTDWDGVGPSVLTIAGAGGAPVSPKRFDTAFMTDLVRLFHEEIDLTIGDHIPQLKMTDGRFTAGLMAIKQESAILRDSVEKVIRTVFGPDSLQRDQDGDYQIKVVGIPIWGRLVSGDPSYLSVFATLLTEVEGTPDLLAELNDLNSNLTFVRVDWREGLVTARVDLVAETLDPTELFTAYQRVNDAASNISPMLNAMFGGDTLDRDAERWSAYLETTITAEIVPNTIESLNGPTASEQWLFDSPVHVITAWNPYNIIRSPEENDRSNTELAVALAGRGARFARARGSANDGLHFEDSFITWNLTREDAIDVGREFRQEAVFELTADEFRLVHCGTGAVASAPRT
jgi:hypothetical protein